jgi:hypothetical protein
MMRTRIDDNLKIIPAVCKILEDRNTVFNRRLKDVVMDFLYNNNKKMGE